MTKGNEMPTHKPAGWDEATPEQKKYWKATGSRIQARIFEQYRSQSDLERKTGITQKTQVRAFYQRLTAPKEAQLEKALGWDHGTIEKIAAGKPVHDRPDWTDEALTMELVRRFAEKNRQLEDLQYQTGYGLAARKAEPGVDPS